MSAPSARSPGCTRSCVQGRACDCVADIDTPADANRIIWWLVDYVFAAAMGVAAACLLIAWCLG